MDKKEETVEETVKEKKHFNVGGLGSLKDMGVIPV